MQRTTTVDGQPQSPRVEGSPQDDATSVSRHRDDPAQRTKRTPTGWEFTASGLAEYAYNILRGWIISGAIADRVRKATGIRLAWQPELRQADNAQELAGMTIAIALTRFRAILGENRWDPGRGTRMETYFIGQCLIQFPNEYRRWLRENRDHGATCSAGLDEIADLPDSGPSGNTEGAALSRLTIAAVLAELPNGRMRSAALLTAQGYRHEDIARRLGTSAKAVEMLLYRMRVAHRASNGVNRRHR